MLCARQLGLPEHACYVTGGMLELARYKIKTALGISEGEYSRMEERMLHGILQGGKASSFIWLIVSSLIMEIMKETCEGVSFKDPRSTMESTRAMDGFVDDTTAWTNQFKEYYKKNTRGARFLGVRGCSGYFSQWRSAARCRHSVTTLIPLILAERIRRTCFHFKKAKGRENINIKFS